MAVSFYVTDSNHQKLHYNSDPHGTLMGLTEKMPRKSLVHGILPWGDTMFNALQLRIILDEIDAIPDRHPAWDDLRESVVMAIQHNGYLVFIGD